jgi:CRISPR-associated protein Csb1
MSDLITKFDDLLADTGPAAITLAQWLKPVGDPIIFPPTYANPKEREPAVYNIDYFGDTASLERRFELKKTHTWINSERVEEGHIKSVCVLDSIPSQANRIEPAFGRLRDEKGNSVRLVPTVKVQATVDGEQVEIDLLEDAGHRIADAAIRHTSIAEDVNKAILARKQRPYPDSKPLALLAPTSLIFGMWDSQASGVKVPRLINSIIRAYDVCEYRRSSQFNPAMDFEAAGVTTEKGDVRLSEVGMDGAPSTFQLGGVEAMGGIHLRFLARCCLHPPERHRRVLTQVPQESFDAVVTGSAARLLADQVLVDPPPTQALGHLLLNDRPPWLTIAGRPRRRTRRCRQSHLRPEGRVGGCCWG